MKGIFRHLAIGSAGAVILLVAVGCAESPEDRQLREQTAISEATKLVDEGQFAQANSKLGQITDTPQVLELRRRAREGLDRQEAEERAKALAAKGAELKSDLEGLTAAHVSDMSGVRSALDVFEEAGSYLTQTSALPLDVGAKRDRASLRSLLARKQAALLPVMRQTYGKDLGRTLWENDVEVLTHGNGHRRIRFIAGMFAANRNIAEAQRAATPMLQRLRFSRSQYEWYRGSEYTYYDMEAPSDATVAD